MLGYLRAIGLNVGGGCKYCIAPETEEAPGQYKRNRALGRADAAHPAPGIRKVLWAIGMCLNSIHVLLEM